MHKTVKHNKNLQDISGPVVIGGVGGSGTRVIAEILRELNFFIGNDLNGPLDNLTYTFLFKRKKWYYKNYNKKKKILRGLGILKKTMTSSGSLSLSEYTFLFQAVLSMSLYGHYKNRGKGIWPILRLKKMFNSTANNLSSYSGWGWKEPNSHLLLEYMNEFFPDIKYIHAIRNGLDMAYSRNHRQLYHWGPLFGINPRDNQCEIPELSFRYWVEANSHVMDIGKKMDSDKFLLLNFDRLCKNPKEGIIQLLAFLDINPDSKTMTRILSLPKVISSIGRYRNKDLSWVKESDISFLLSMGFTVDLPKRNNS